jgi:hypothetical protein
MNDEDLLLQKIRDALQLRKDIDSGDVVLLDGEKVKKAFDYLQRAKVSKAVKPRLSENAKLWGLVAIATWGMAIAVALSVHRIF